MAARELIDNRFNVYIPFKLKCGVTLQCRVEVFNSCSKVIEHLQNDVSDCFKVLPVSVHSLLRKTNIWVNYTYRYGLSQCPKHVKHSTVHHGEGWLICTRDNPQKVLGIEIYDCNEYENLRLHWNGCGLILHEFCHLIHQIVLPDGLDNQTVWQAYQEALETGKYENVYRRDWAGLSIEIDQAYATINHKEFFAEMSVAFLSSDYRDLDHIRGPLDKCSPIFLEEKVLKRITDKQGNDKQNRKSSTSSLQKNSLIENMLNFWIPKNKFSHCNKFYPFTRGQMKSYDPKLSREFSRIWFFIAEWDDPTYHKCKLWNCFDCTPCRGDTGRTFQTITIQHGEAYSKLYAEEEIDQTPETSISADCSIPNTVCL